MNRNKKLHEQKIVSALKESQGKRTRGGKGKPVLAAEHLHLEVEGQRDEGEQNRTNQLRMQDSLPRSSLFIRVHKAARTSQDTVRLVKQVIETT